MAYQQKDMSGSLFKNDRKEKDTHPDYRGDIVIDGVSYWLSAWVKTSKNGGKFMSLAAKPKDGGKGADKPTPQQEARKPAREEMDDEIPF